MIFFNKNNLIHGDLKPENILLGFDGNAYVGDFGTAIVVKSSSRGGDLYGYSEQYAAPEMFEFEQKYKESDIWSFGALIFQYLFEIAPYQYLNRVNKL